MTSRCTAQGAGHTGVRALSEMTGLRELDWRPFCGSGPTAIALHDITYYVYSLTSTIPKAAAQARFKDQHQKYKSSIRAPQWTTMEALAQDNQFRDTELLGKLTHTAVCRE